MDLKVLLSRFETPAEAAKVAGMGRTAAYHWYAVPEKMSLPSVEVIVRFADHFGLSDTELGSVIRSRARMKKELLRLAKLRREAKQRQKRAESVERHKKEKNRQFLARQHRQDGLIVRKIETEEKELYLDERDRLENLEQILIKGLN
tara:strand:- start:712 stop:1152 length:441 start_codon:yes stop_codon:yes gene_type:complete